MQKKILITIIVLLILIGTFVISNLASKENVKTANPMDEFYQEIPVAEQKEATTITIDEYYNLKKANDIHIIYLARPTCGYCTLESPVFYHVLYEYNLNAYYLNIDSLTAEEYNAFVASDETYTDLGTPTIVVTKNNSIIKALKGLTGSADIISAFKELGIIGE